jgi:tetratricopeptide (TPR) repeat protein
MNVYNIASEIDRLSNMVDKGMFDAAFDGVEAISAALDGNVDHDAVYFRIISAVASLYIDIGAMKPCKTSAEKGLSILTLYPNEIAEQIEQHTYYYNLSNAKSNFIEDKNPFNHTFSTIQQLIEIKTLLWKAIKSCETAHKIQVDPTFIVNLGNALKQQFRLTEALDCYDRVNSLQLDIPQAWINRSETLMLLNEVSGSYSIQMMEQIKKGYESVLLSKEIPPSWIDYYKEQAAFHQKKIAKACKEHNVKLDSHDSDKTRAEYNSLTEYRKFCLDRGLTLSEHGLYCACVGSARDNLTIPTSSGLVGDFVIPMEMVLNRLKSEFSFARHLYYEYICEDTDYELINDSCFSELFNDELLGVDVEKLRAAFRSCFGILDKIGIAVCELFDVYPSNKTVYFQSFWQLDQDDRRDKFNSIKNPGLLALYSIATDLNDRKGGEWSFLKQLRNDLEHEFVVIHKMDEPSDVYGSYKFMDQIVFIQEEVFLNHFERILQLTRSAIFSFVFAVREKARAERREDVEYFRQDVHSKNYKP